MLLRLRRRLEETTTGVPVGGIWCNCVGALIYWRLVHIHRGRFFVSRRAFVPGHATTPRGGARRGILVVVVVAGGSVHVFGWVCLCVGCGSVRVEWGGVEQCFII